MARKTKRRRQPVVRVANHLYNEVSLMNELIQRKVLDLKVTNLYLLLWIFSHHHNKWNFRFTIQNGEYISCDKTKSYIKYPQLLVNWNYLFSHLLHRDLSLNRHVFYPRICTPQQNIGCHWLLNITPSQHAQRLASTHLHGNTNAGRYISGTLCKQCRLEAAIYIDQVFESLSKFQINLQFIPLCRCFLNNILIQYPCIKLLFSNKNFNTHWLKCLIVSIQVC